jgi:hypothetical protein
MGSPAMQVVTYAILELPSKGGENRANEQIVVSMELSNVPYIKSPFQNVQLE